MCDSNSMEDILEGETIGARPPRKSSKDSELDKPPAEMAQAGEPTMKKGLWLKLNPSNKLSGNYLT